MSEDIMSEDIMSEDNAKNMADRLIEADSHRSSPNAAAFDPSFERLLEIERRFEEKVQKVAVVSWSVAFVCLVLFAIIFIILRNGGDGMWVEVIRAVLVVIAITGPVTFLVATVASIRLLFRSRTPTLQAIEKRLAALEKRMLE